MRELKAPYYEKDLHGYRYNSVTYSDGEKAFRAYCEDLRERLAATEQKLAEAGKVETANGICGPGARVISRQIHCPKCGVKFYHDEAWTKPAASANPRE